MATEIRQFAATIPAGTPAIAPVSVDMSFPPRVVTGLTIVVPPGPSGLLGFRITNSRVPVIPFAGSDWIVTSGEIIDWPLTDYIDSGAWGLDGYNTGAYPHTVYVRFLLDLVTAAGPPAPTLIPPAVLGPAAVPMLPASAGGLAALGITGG